MHGTHWQTDSYLAAESYLTGHKILVNTDPHRFLISLERWDAAEIRRRIAVLEEYWAPMRTYLRPSDILRTHIGAFQAAENVQQFGIELDSLLAERMQWSVSCRDEKFWRGSPWKRNDRTRIKELIGELWAAEILALPTRHRLLHYAHFDINDHVGKDCTITAVESMIPKTNSSTFKRAKYTFDAMLMRTCGIHDIGDVTPNVIGEVFTIFKGKAGKTISTAIIEAQRCVYGDAVRHTVEDFRYLDRPRVQPDMAFDWVVDCDTEMEEWRRLAAEYVAQLPSNLGNRKNAIVQFFRYLLANPLLPRSPGAYLKRGAHLQPAYVPSGAACSSYLADFFDWVLDTRFTKEGDDGTPIRFPEMENPIASGGWPEPDLAETGREAMPARYIRMALQILTENDWNWAKNAFRSKTQSTDWFSRQNAENGEWEKVWSPVRAYALYVKLRMPFRTMQVRTMDDGSSDTYIYDDVKGVMVPNPSPLRQGSARAPVQRGALQAITDQKTRRSVLHIRLTTNKTADVNKESWQKGYTCPWAPDDVVKLLVELCRWQQRFNPISEPTSWRKLKEFRGWKSDVELTGMESCFLFRDPAERTRRDEPIRDVKIRGLWLKLLQELERRLAAQGILGADSQPIKFVTTCNTYGVPTSAVYDLHSLRVSLITNLLETKEVPVEVMMKVVGHATVVMTLYYVKHSTAYVADCFSAAEAKMIQDEQHNWIRHVRSQALKDISRAVVHMSEAGLTAFSNTSSSSLMIVNIGLCPVGGALCHKGGSKLTGDSSRQDYSSVPGGRSNCAGCRFVISGEPWLHGIHCEFNVRSFEAAGLSRQREKLEADFEMLDGQRRACEATGEAFPRHREWERASNDLEEMDARLAQLGVEMANLWALKDQVERIMEERRKEGGAKHALVVGDIEAVQAALEESTEWELADRICKASVLYPSIAARGNLPQYANELRLKRYDRILRKNGLQPRFLDMDEETALYVGNQLSSFLMLRIGRENTLRLMEGDATFETLREILLPQEFRHELDATLDAMIGQPLAISRRALEPPCKQLVAGE